MWSLSLLHGLSTFSNILIELDGERSHLGPMPTNEDINPTPIQLELVFE